MGNFQNVDCPQNEDRKEGGICWKETVITLKLNLNCRNTGLKRSCLALDHIHANLDSIINTMKTGSFGDIKK